MSSFDSGAAYEAERERELRQRSIDLCKRTIALHQGTIENHRPILEALEKVWAVYDIAGDGSLVPVDTARELATYRAMRDDAVAAIQQNQAYLEMLTQEQG